MVYGGPGVCDYLAPVADLIDDLCLVHRYDQRGTGGSGWEGQHTIARHVQDLALLLDAWGHERVVLVAIRTGAVWLPTFCWPIRCGWPGWSRSRGRFWVPGGRLIGWRSGHAVPAGSRPGSQQQTRLAELDARRSRTEAEEIEYLTLSWCSEHADRARAWEWALASARVLRPVNYAMNAQLNAATKADPLESHVGQLRERLPPGAVIIGGAGDSRPADALRRLGARLGSEVVIVAGAGHDPWLEAPGPFGVALRAAVVRQIHRGR